jgi:hypothetical protein
VSGEYVVTEESADQVQVNSVMSLLEIPPTKLDLACGQNKQEGFFGVDAFSKDADLHMDLLHFPWPFVDDSVEEIFCSHFVEHIPHWRPWFPENTDGLFLFMDEVWRICQDGARVKILHPYSKSDRADQDPSHTRRINEVTWWYFNREWRETQKLDHYPVRCDFEVRVGHPWNDAAPFKPQLRSDTARGFGVVHYQNVIPDLMIELIARKV